jgi:DNA-binding MarR family transcriptional regulator
MKTANALHSLSIHLLRRARVADQESGLSPERLSLLSVLAYAGPRTINELSEIESVSAPAISRIVTALQSLGYVKRIRSQSDARSVIVEATPKGRRLMESGRLRRLERIAEELSRLSKTELALMQKASMALAKLEKPRA